MTRRGTNGLFWSARARLRACKLAGLQRVRVEFVEREMTESDVLAEQVVENAVRSDLQPVESGRAYKRLMDLNGWTAQQVAETLGIEPTAVYLCALAPEASLGGGSAG